VAADHRPERPGRVLVAKRLSLSFTLTTRGLGTSRSPLLAVRRAQIMPTTSGDGPPQGADVFVREEPQTVAGSGIAGLPSLGVVSVGAACHAGGRGFEFLVAWTGFLLRVAFKHQPPLTGDPLANRN
jgi:hypothetical protein